MSTIFNDMHATITMEPYHSEEEDFNLADIESAYEEALDLNSSGQTDATAVTCVSDDQDEDFDRMIADKDTMGHFDLNSSGHTDATTMTCVSDDQDDDLDRMLADEDTMGYFINAPPFGAPFQSSTTRNSSRVWSTFSGLRNSSLGSLFGNSSGSPYEDSWWCRNPSNEPRDELRSPSLPKAFNLTRKSSATRGIRNKRKKTGQKMDVDEPNLVEGLLFENLHVTPPVSPVFSKGKVSPKLSPLAKRMRKGFLGGMKMAAGASKTRSGLKSSTSNGPKVGAKLAQSSKKRLRRKEPAKKVYVDITDNDVLLGRGGLSNHHPGNQAYRKHILSNQKLYKDLENTAKTQMSIDVVDWVKARGGRFLKRDDAVVGRPFYIATDATARQKVSQALREDHTPEGRRLKKSRTKK